MMCLLTYQTGTCTNKEELNHFMELYMKDMENFEAALNIKKAYIEQQTNKIKETKDKEKKQELKEIIQILQKSRKCNWNGNNSHFLV
jgi:hypothetical protein